MKNNASVYQNLKKEPDKHFVVKQIEALALLPEVKIEPTYQKIKKAAQEKFGTYFNEFFDYYESYWLKR